MDTKKGERLVMTIEEAAQALGICQFTAYKLAKKGGIPVLRLGRRWVVPIKQLERLLNGEDKATS